MLEQYTERQTDLGTAKHTQAEEESTALTHNALMLGAVILVKVRAVHGAVTHGDDPGTLGSVLWLGCLLPSQTTTESLRLITRLRFSGALRSSTGTAR